MNNQEIDRLVVQVGESIVGEDTEFQIAMCSEATVKLLAEIAKRLPESK